MWIYFENHLLEYRTCFILLKILITTFTMTETDGNNQNEYILPHAVLKDRTTLSNRSMCDLLFQFSDNRSPSNSCLDDIYVFKMFSVFMLLQPF